MVARSHPKWGERVSYGITGWYRIHSDVQLQPMAFVILNAHGERKWNGKEEIFEKELKAFARGRLPGFASPEWVAIVHELPKTS